MLFTLTQDDLNKKLASQLNREVGSYDTRQFPDKETYIKINADVENKKIIIIESLNNPDAKTLPLILLAETLRDLGATEIGLVSPYLAYMRQDKRFNEGEGITSKYFATLISNHFDWLITIDPHLHRYKSLNEIYTIPTTVLHATSPIAEWVKNKVDNPLIVGPDSESEQWAATIAKEANAPYIILQKHRFGDEDVKIAKPDLTNYQTHTAVLVDDIISSAHTMMEGVKLFQQNKPICIGVHGLFSHDGFEKLSQVKPEKIITCNTIPHVTNAIDISPILIAAISERNLSK